MATRTVKLTAVKKDELMYPRYRIDLGVVAKYMEAMDSGAVFPPITVDQNMRVMDGVHRLTAYEKRQVEEVTVEVQRVRDDSEFFRRSLEMNSSHGRQFTQIDYAHMILRGRELGIDEKTIAELVHVTPGYLEEATRGWFARNKEGEMIPLKRTIQHMAGQKLTDEQVAANRKLGGWGATFYINQISMLLENDLINMENKQTMEALRKLEENLRMFFMGRQKYAKMRRTA